MSGRRGERAQGVATGRRADDAAATVRTTGRPSGLFLRRGRMQLTGDPVDAFNKDKAAYVSDVASTAFSASSTAFLVAPNPVTGAVAVGTGLVWAGAEVVDHWDDISDGASKLAKGASKAWDKITPW